MSEGEVEHEITILMVKEMVEDVCGSVEDGKERAKCRVILHRILVHGRGFDELNELSEETRRVIREKLREMGVG